MKVKGHSSKVKVTKIKNVKITVFGLVSEKKRFKVKIARVKVKVTMIKGQGQSFWGSSVKEVRGKGRPGRGQSSRSRSLLEIKVRGQGHLGQV